jgi:hypothetical protein
MLELQCCIAMLFGIPLASLGLCVGARNGTWGSCLGLCLGPWGGGDRVTWVHSPGDSVGMGSGEAWNLPGFSLALPLGHLGAVGMHPCDPGCSRAGLACFLGGPYSLWDSAITFFHYFYCFCYFEAGNFTLAGNLRYVMTYTYIHILP